MNVREVMTPHPTCCTADSTLEEAARLMVDCDCGAIPVVDDEIEKKPIGIITDRDIVVRAIAAGRDPQGISVGDCMSAPAVSVREDTDLDECVALLEDRQIRRVVVVDGDGKCIGIVAQADVAMHASKRRSGELLEQVSRPVASDVFAMPPTNP
jgi:CBS domain-containing protein